MPVVGLGVGLLVLVSWNTAEACWFKKRCAAPACTNLCSSSAYADPCGPAAGAVPGAALRPVPPDQTSFSIGGPITPPPPPPPPCPPGMVYAYCDIETGLWRQTSYPTSEGCVSASLIGTECTGTKGKPPKDDEAKSKDRPKDDIREQLVPMVCDVQTRKFRRANPGESPHAYLPARYLGRPCALPKQ